MLRTLQSWEPEAGSLTESILFLVQAKSRLIFHPSAARMQLECRSSAIRVPLRADRVPPDIATAEAAVRLARRGTGVWQAAPTANPPPTLTLAPSSVR